MFTDKEAIGIRLSSGAGDPEFLSSSVDHAPVVNGAEVSTTETTAMPVPATATNPLLSTAIETTIEPQSGGFLFEYVLLRSKTRLTNAEAQSVMQKEMMGVVTKPLPSTSNTFRKSPLVNKATETNPSMMPHHREAGDLHPKTPSISVQQAILEDKTSEFKAALLRVIQGETRIVSSKRKDFLELYKKAVELGRVEIIEFMKVKFPYIEKVYERDKQIAKDKFETAGIRPILMVSPPVMPVVFYNNGWQFFYATHVPALTPAAGGAGAGPGSHFAVASTAVGGAVPTPAEAAAVGEPEAKRLRSDSRRDAAASNTAVGDNLTSGRDYEDGHVGGKRRPLGR